MGKFFEHVFSTIGVKLLTIAKTSCNSEYLTDKKRTRFPSRF